MDASRDDAYFLPHHASLTSLDPLDVCGDLPEAIRQDGTVSQGYLLKTALIQADADLARIESVDGRGEDHLRQWVARFDEMVQVLAYSLHQAGHVDTGFLQEVLAEQTWDHLACFRSHLLQVALELPDLFPSGTLDYLSCISPEQSFSGQQVDSLLSHLFLGTLQIPKGNDWGRPGFLAYFRGDPPIESTVRGYATTLIAHFASGGYTKPCAGSEDGCFVFRWSTSDGMADVASANVSATLKIKLVAQAIEPSAEGDADTFVLLNAHSQPGPGPSGTHEEKLMGQSPALAITSLVAPLLDKKAAIVTSAFPVHGQWQGYGRKAHLVQLFDATAGSTAHQRRYIIADALELDMASDSGALPDLDQGNVLREVKKLYAGFKGALSWWQSADTAGRSSAPAAFRIEAVPWGCQAFGGDLVVKAQCMIMAAALANIQSVDLYIPTERLEQAQQIQALSEQHKTAAELFARLTIFKAARESTL
ncbi:hypothetical protein EX895_001552 [Sporisorium graminicola]|uniref:PARG catalytic Macro domain-containing protein n=1 Tax=Sporisorium graminicola TaxID=280036 RepID=A0A4U7KZJ5_9BASI|nr:hypothetical protein EX895_001552 [Sporisorium graminicola]TKY89767.1 hypothetical protein EX895_001552 [Sporisorium graminicola]